LFGDFSSDRSVKAGTFNVGQRDWCEAFSAAASSAKYGPSLAANSDPTQPLGIFEQHTIGQPAVTPSPARISSCCFFCSAKSAYFACSLGARLNPGHTPDLRLSVLVSSQSSSPRRPSLVHPAATFAEVHGNQPASSCDRSIR
jgi:hypothetical protein